MQCNFGVHRYVLVGGLEHFFQYIGNNHPNWLNNIFQSVWNHQPVSIFWRGSIKMILVEELMCALPTQVMFPAWSIKLLGCSLHNFSGEEVQRSPKKQTFMFFKQNPMPYFFNGKPISSLFLVVSRWTPLSGGFCDGFVGRLHLCTDEGPGSRAA